VTIALVALAIVGIIAMAGLSIDVGTLYQASAEAQRAADAGALAAARTMSMLSVTGDPISGPSSGTWADVCGGDTSPASLAAKTVAAKNPISGASINPSVTVTYSVTAGAQSTDCTGVGSLRFGVNPLVTVVVQQTNLPTYFARVWGRSGNTVSATATAEVFNPSNSATYAGNMVPVQPRCVKPWMVPNYEPWSPALCTTTTPCTPFVDNTTGAIQNSGMQSVNPGSVIGQRFWLLPDCTVSAAGTPCSLRSSPPQPNYVNAGDVSVPPTPNLEYLPGSAAFASIAVPSDGTTACTNVAGGSQYSQAIAGCDQLTQYQCGVAGATTPNQVDLSENPGSGDTMNGVQCLIHEQNISLTGPQGQDVLLPFGTSSGSLPPNYPFQIQVGTSSPLRSAGIGDGTLITSSNSIVSIPIYDGNNPISGTGTSSVTIVGFLQVFINVVDAYGNMYVTVMNVSGCGNGVVSPTSVMNGTSSVPVRLVTPQ
jgi:type II secretory pathway pseudopilin PulG